VFFKKAYAKELKILEVKEQCIEEAAHNITRARTRQLSHAPDGLSIAVKPQSSNLHGISRKVIYVVMG
jgi:hypothetical protein